LLLENSTGFAKRLQFIKEVIEHSKPKLVLDFGCGTGNNVTVPLADYFPDVKFTGVDSDVTSIEFARNNNTRSNLTFAYPKDIETYHEFDLIIASEVIEHVEEPEELLLFLEEKLVDGGQIILTLPNGYGPSEFMSLVASLLHLSGIYVILRQLKRTLSGSSTSLNSKSADTLAISPHINFFSYNEIKSLIGKAGFKLLEYRPRTWLCGFGFNQILHGQFILSLNAKLADYLPPYFISGWMFLLKKEECRQLVRYQYKRNYYARLRKYLNEKRWGLTKR
jgi:SAM-dependent methyltransferase